MLLLSSPRSGRRLGAPPLLLLFVLLSVGTFSARSRATGHDCPSVVSCAKERRKSCRTGSSHCGPCLSSLEENTEGRCVEMKRYGKVTYYPNLEDEIDLLQSIIQKQEVTDIKMPKQQNKPVAALAPQTDDKKNKTDASKNKQKNEGHLSDEVLPATVPTTQFVATEVVVRAGPAEGSTSKNNKVVVIMISLFVVLGTMAVILATICFIKTQRESRLAEKVEYPAFGGGAMQAPANDGTTSGDKSLAQNAQMYHYQHQKQQMLSLGNHKPEQKSVDTEVTSDEEDVGGDFTVYECPGLAPTGEMEVKNPLFDDSNLHDMGNTQK